MKTDWSYDLEHTPVLIWRVPTSHLSEKTTTLGTSSKASKLMTVNLQFKRCYIPSSTSSMSSRPAFRTSKTNKQTWSPCPARMLHVCCDLQQLLDECTSPKQHPSHHHSHHLKLRLAGCRMQEAGCRTQDAG